MTFPSRFAPGTALGCGTRISLWIFLLLIFSGNPAAALPSFEDFNNSRNKDAHVQVSAMVEPQKVSPGQTFHLHVVVRMGEGWHIYSINPQGENRILATQLHLDENGFHAENDWTESKPKIILDKALEKVVKTHESSAEFVREFRVPPDIRPGTHSLSGVIMYRVCDNKVCSLPKKLNFKTKARVVGDRDS